MNKYTPVRFTVLLSIGLTACSQNNKIVQDRSHNADPDSPTSVLMQGDVDVQASPVVFQQQRQTTSAQQAPFYQQASRSVVRPTPPVQPVRPPQSTPPQNELYAIGDKIFKNEAGGKINNLVHWNKGEDFAAMGIGHFTWYPSGRRTRFGNTFPGLLDYLKKNGVQLPYWVQRARFEGAPWRTRNQLMAVKHTAEIRQFEQLLYNTRHLQAKYIMDRAMRAMPKLVNKTPSYLRTRVANNLNAVANTPGGRYVLVDYVNFKGEGLNRTGGYKGHNWGLLQVLEDMHPSAVGPQALNEFANAAMRVLERRVRNSPPARNEKKWLPGWRNRINTYRNPI